MNWIYRSGDDSTGCRDATCKEDGSTYYGEWSGSQPNGLGARSKDGVFIEGGYWSNGILIDSMTQEEYDKEITKLIADKTPRRWVR